MTFQPSLPSLPRRLPAPTPLWVCDKCLGPLEVAFDYDAIARTITRETIEARPKNLWRYRELLPIAGEPRTGLHSGFTPLVKRRPARRSGSASASCTSRTTRSTIRPAPTRIASCRSRPRARSSSASRCSPARRPATSPAASRRTPRASGLACSVFIPDDLEAGKVAGAGVYRPRIIAVRGNYDDVNRLCTQVADQYGWGFANINLRAYYAEGAKTYGFEIAEQLGWRFPRHVVSPVAGGTLLPRILQGLRGAADGRPRRGRPADDPRGAGGRLRAGRATRSTPGSSSPNRSSRRRSPSRLRSAIRPTASRCCARCDRPAAPARWSTTTRSSPASSCWPRPKASSPSRPAA